MQSSAIRQAISALGTTLGPDVVEAARKLFDTEQQAMAEQYPAVATDIAYGEHERHRLDIYGPAHAGKRGLPVVLFVHGGGFLKGDKGSNQHWQNANVGRLCAQAGLIGAVMNYRLAPDNTWPSGGEDVSAAVAWLKNSVAEYGGDASNIILMGTSAGAVHLCTYLQLNPATEDVRGLVLLSGLYGFTRLDDRDTLYYGSPELYGNRRPLEAISDTKMPLLVWCAEFDPPRFQEEFSSLLLERLKRHGRMPRSGILSGHNHYSMAMHLGSSDRRLSDEIIAFVQELCL